MNTNHKFLIEHLLKDKIPISDTMGITILDVGPLDIKMLLPLMPNRNHKGTLFGGSLYSGAALACYGLFLHGLSTQGFTTDDIVISEGNIAYLKPVKSDAIIIASWPGSLERDEFYKGLSKKGRARVTISANIMTDDIVCATFKSQFVAKLDR